MCRKIRLNPAPSFCYAQEADPLRCCSLFSASVRPNDILFSGGEVRGRVLVATLSPMSSS